MRVLPSLTVIVGVALGILTAQPGHFVLHSLLPSLAIAAAAPLAASIAIAISAPGSDVTLVSTAGMLTALGVVSLFLAALSPSAQQPFLIDIVLRQGLFVGVGFIALIAGALLAHHIERLSRFPFVILLGALALTMLTAVVGQTINGARLWLRVGSYQFQPSELTRLLVAVFAARYIYDHRHHIAAPWRFGLTSSQSLPYLLPLAAAIVASSSVLVFQADLGMASLIVVAAFLTYAAIQRSRTALVVAALALIVAGICAMVSTERARERVLAWIDPWQDPAGRGFQLIQADYSFALGGLAGRLPPRLGTVPEVHTDLILVAIGNEFGWLGAIGTLALLAVLICRCVMLALSATGGFAPLLILSVAALLGVQTILIVGGTIRALPLTGLTLPLVSYGGTSMIATLFALGVVLGLGRRAQYG